MATIQTKYDIGQEVYWIDRNKVKSGSVILIKAESLSRNDLSTKYEIVKEQAPIVRIREEEDIFHTLEEAQKECDRRNNKV